MSHREHYFSLSLFALIQISWDGRSRLWRTVQSCAADSRCRLQSQPEQRKRYRGLCVEITRRQRNSLNHTWKGFVEAELRFFFPGVPPPSVPHTHTQQQQQQRQQQQQHTLHPCLSLFFTHVAPGSLLPLLFSLILTKTKQVLGSCDSVVFLLSVCFSCCLGLFSAALSACLSSLTPSLLLSSLIHTYSVCQPFIFSDLIRRFVSVTEHWE